MGRMKTYCHVADAKQHLVAVLYYTSHHFICWDFDGMTIEDPKILFQYQNEIA